MEYLLNFGICWGLVGLIVFIFLMGKMARSVRGLQAKGVDEDIIDVHRADMFLPTLGVILWNMLLFGSILGGIVSAIYAVIG